MNKKEYAAPRITIYDMEPLCSNGIVLGSVHEATTSGKLIDKIDVKEEDQTKDMNIWDDKKNWGDD